MAEKEAKARIKINKLLEEAGWRFFDSDAGKANILLEKKVKITKEKFHGFGDDFENTTMGFVDFLLVDEKENPIVVLEAKAENKHPLYGKEQARQYAQAINCRYVILSNGNDHYLWDMELGENPIKINKFPSPEDIIRYTSFKPDRNKLINEVVNENYIALTQDPDHETDPSYINESTRKEFILSKKLRFLRKYQLEAVRSIQEAVKKGKVRFLFEMATGTGKTLVSAAVIKLFLKTGNARRVLFLVDRLELEDQAHKAFTEYLKKDYETMIYK